MSKNEIDFILADLMTGLPFDHGKELAIAWAQSLIPKPKDIEDNFEVTPDGGIDTNDSEKGIEYALKFADHTGFNEAVKLMQEALDHCKYTDSNLIIPKPAVKQ